MDTLEYEFEGEVWLWSGKKPIGGSSPCRKI